MSTSYIYDNTILNRQCLSSYSYLVGFHGVWGVRKAEKEVEKERKSRQTDCGRLRLDCMERQPVRWSGVTPGVSPGQPNGRKLTGVASATTPRRAPTGFSPAGRSKPAYCALLMLRAGDIEQNPGPPSDVPVRKLRNQRRRRVGPLPGLLAVVARQRIDGLRIDGHDVQ